MKVKYLHCCRYSVLYLRNIIDHRDNFFVESENVIIYISMNKYE